MKTKIIWNETINGAEYFIEYSGMSFLGNVSLSVNGVAGSYTPVYKQDEGYLVLFQCGGTECILKISPDKKSAEVLTEAPVYHEMYPVNQEGEPVISPVVQNAEFQTGKAPDKNGISGPSFQSVDMNRKSRSGMGSFLSIIVLSLVNMALFYIDAPISFPFSLFGSTLVQGISMGIAEEIGGSMTVTVIGLVLALGIIGIYAILYYFTPRIQALIWVAFGLIIFDTLCLLAFSGLSGAFAESLIDIAFHAWILWSMLQLGIAKGKLRKTIMAKISGFTVAIPASEMLYD